MKLRDFLKDKFIHLMTTLTFVILISALLRAFKTDESCIIVVAVMIVVMNGGLLVYEFLKKRAFYIVLNENIRELDKKYIVVETLPKAEFLEGKILTDTIYDINTSTRDEVNKLYDSVCEFTEYVEMWIHEIKLPIASLVLMNYNGTSDKIKQSIALKKLENYVDQILYFVRSDTPEKDYVMKNYNLEEIVNQVVKDNKELLIGSRIQIRKNNLYLRKNTTIKIGDVLYKPAKSKSISSYITMEAGEENMGILIFPDSCDLEKNVYVKESNLYANYKADSKNERAGLDAYYSDENMDAVVYTKNEIYEASRGTTVMIVFVGLYFGLVFMMASAAILALKILSDAADNKDKYVILRKIGTDNKMITASIAKQCGIYFGLPLLVAIVHSIFGIQTGTNILSFFGKRGMTYSIIVTAIIIVAIYGGYAILTFVCSKRIIDEA